MGSSKKIFIIKEDIGIMRWYKKIYIKEYDKIEHLLA